MKMLCGWKEIAEFLHLTVRTAQRWERAGLPVRRAYESERSPVLASPDELEFWLNTRQRRVRTPMSAAQVLLTSKWAELHYARRRAHRETRRLLRQVTQLGNEQQRLIFLIKANLRGMPHSVDAAQH